MTDLAALVRFAHEAGQLKRTPRTGWQLTASTRPESVAEHSFRVGVLAHAIAVLEGADPDRAAALGLFHDLPEARTGDIPSVGKAYVKVAPPHVVVSDQVDGLPPLLARHIVDLIAEHEGAKTDSSTPEARCSRDADKIECLLQAREYAATGNIQLDPWVESMVRAVTTDTGRALAQAALDVAPSSWFHKFVARYGLPRAVGE